MAIAGSPGWSVTGGPWVYLKRWRVQPNVIITNAKNKILFHHRQSANQDIYWLDNRNDNPTTAEVSFRVTDKTPELWNAQTGKIEKVSYKIEGGRTIVPLNFESWEAFFVVLQHKAVANHFTKPKTTESVFTTISTPWNLAIADNTLSIDKLTSWSENTDATIKYFSVTAIYINSFDINNTLIEGAWTVDLGDVKNIAEVIVNGKNVGTAWEKPFRLDIHDALKTGKNTIEIRVTNTWVNRLIDDAQPDVKQKTTFTTMPFYRADSPLLPSGLLGDVKILVNK